MHQPSGDQVAGEAGPGVAHPTPALRADPPPPGEGGAARRVSPGEKGESGIARFRRRARSLRERQTDPEKRLWSALERVPVEGTHFRRQVPIGPYVADFACLAARLIIELDGGHHARDDVAARDATRQAWLEAQGFRVLRFWNSEIAANLDGVLDTIYAALHGHSSAEAQAFKHRRRRREDR